MNAYISWVEAHPIISAIIQFAILGTLGEIISQFIARKSFKYPFTFGLTLWKMVVWGVLSIGVKYAFTGFGGYVDSLVEAGFWPDFAADSWGYAFSRSAFMNLQFGLFLVIMHRVLDNIPEKVKNWGNMDKSMYSLLWFWIPAHTLTFKAPDALRMGLAALLSIALGLILGFFNRK